MKRIILFSVAAAFAAAASAQQYKWVDQNGRTQYGDFPPPGVKATPLQAPAGPSAAPAPSSGAAKSPGAPLTAKEQEQAFRERQMDAEKRGARDAQAARDADTKKENCARAQENLRALTSGQRISRND